MKLTAESLKNERAAWEAKGYHIPAFDRADIAPKTLEHPYWIQFGGGNLFKAFQARLAQEMIEKGVMDRGVIAVNREGEGMHQPNDNYSILATLKSDGTVDKTVICSIVKDYLLTAPGTEDFEGLKGHFQADSLQMVTFTITEKGYSLVDGAGNTHADIAADFEAGPEKATSFLGRVCALLYARYQAGAAPLALVSTDNCSHNGDKIRAFVTAFAEKWTENGLADAGFKAYIAEKVSCPWTMIDKITPRPDPTVQKMLEADGVQGLDMTVTPTGTYIAPYVNSEETEYLVIENLFPNGRPPLDTVGVIFTDRETVDKVEKMKVCTCLNPLHTCLAIYGCLLGYQRICDEMEDPELVGLIKTVGYKEGLPVVVDPGILDPKQFIDTVIEVRLPNPFMPDTPQRIALDTSQKIPIRFGNTIKAYMDAADKDVHDLKLIPLVLAGWLRYLMALDDEGKPFERSDDPMLAEVTPYVAGLKLEPGQDVEAAVAPILHDKVIFNVDLYEAGLAEAVVSYLKELTAGPGAIRATLKKYVH